VTERELDLLMDRLADGDRGAFEPLFRALWPRALAAAGRRLAPHAAADAAQSTMVRVFARAPEFSRGAPVLPWFYAIAANEVRALLRRDERHAALEAAPDVAAREDPEALVLERELRASLARAIDALDEPSAQAIAALLGEGPRPAIDDAAFRKRVSRAYAKLRVLLGGHGER
jgi:DNA-directed RNA polymerase specialized sigma24 family protein